MFESLTDRMTKAIRNLRGLSKLTEDNVAEALKDVRMALLSADVHFKVVSSFIERVKAECMGLAVTEGVQPGQMIVKVLHDELVKLLGEGAIDLSDKKPLRILMVGLHGSGKTTSSGKLVARMNKKGYKAALIACDVYRPAAIDQLEYIAKQTGSFFYAERNNQDVLAIAKNGLREAEAQGADLIIFDTAGRLQIDEALIQEIKNLRTLVDPDEVLLVADGALGQEAVNIAKHFNEALSLTGIILTKLDGDARGGAALSMKAITQVPLRFLGTGEKMDALELFHADRMAQRILGMGDVVSLVEKAQEVISEKEAAKMAEKIRRAQFDLNDFLAQMQQMKKMGSLGSLLKMIPGAQGLQVGDKEMNEMKRTEAILQSMTLQERQSPQILNASRRVRIARGSGTQVSDVNELLKKFTQMQKMMKMLQGGKGKELIKRFTGGLGKGGGPGAPGPLGF